MCSSIASGVGAHKYTRSLTQNLVSTTDHDHISRPQTQCDTILILSRVGFLGRLEGLPPRSVRG